MPPPVVPLPLGAGRLSAGLHEHSQSAIAREGEFSEISSARRASGRGSPRLPWAAGRGFRSRRLPASSRAAAPHPPTSSNGSSGRPVWRFASVSVNPTRGRAACSRAPFRLTPAECLADAAGGARFVWRGRGRLRGEAVTEPLFDPAPILAVPQASTVCASLAVRYRHLEAGQPVFAP